MSELGYDNEVTMTINNDEKKEVENDDPDKVLLLTSDNQDLLIPRELAEMSGTINDLLQDVTTEHRIPLNDVTYDIMQKIVVYLQYHHDHPEAVEDPNKKEDDDKKEEKDPFEETEQQKWDNEYFKMDKETLFAVILAANYLDVKELTKRAAKAIAQGLKGKSVQEMRDFLGIECDFTPEELAKIQEENAWARD